MKRLFFFILPILLLSCHTPQVTERDVFTIVSTDTIIQERLVPVVNPADSASLIALMRCDEHGRVLLGWYEQQLSRNSELEFSLDSLGRLLARFRTRPDTAYVQVADTTVNRKEQTQQSETKIVEVEKPLTRWQGYLQTCGMIFNLFLLVIVGTWWLKK